MATPSEVESLFTPSVLASLGSFFVAAAALVLALSSRSVARRRERSALYLDLKARFANVYKDLAHIYKQASLPEDEEDQLKLFAYWQHSFDECYATVKLGQKLEKQLWGDYFSAQVVNGLKHGALREAYLYVSLYDRELGHRKEFCTEVERCYKAQNHGKNIPDCKSPVLQSLIDRNTLDDA